MCKCELKINIFVIIFIAILSNQCNYVLGVDFKYETNIKYGFKYLNWDFPTTTEENDFLNNKYYQTMIPGGIKVNSKGEHFLSVPRWQNHVPSTLNKIISKNGKTLLSPYPTWDENKQGDANALQSVLGFEIDKSDNIWALDMGKVNGQRAIEKSIKLVKISGQTNIIEKRYVIPESIASLEDSLLNDLVIDNVNNYIYISDTGLSINAATESQGQIIVFDMKTETFNGILKANPIMQVDKSIWITMDGEHVYKNGQCNMGVNGIALSCDTKYLYFTALTSRILYGIETQYLRNVQLNDADILKQVKNLGYKTTATDGMTISQSGKFYMSALEQNAIIGLDQTDFTENSFDYHNYQALYQDTNLIWADGFGWNNIDQTLLFVNLQYNKFAAGEINFENPKNGQYNFRVYEMKVGQKSYQYGCTSQSYGIIIKFIQLQLLAVIIILLLIY